MPPNEELQIEKRNALSNAVVIVSLPDLAINLLKQGAV